MRVTSFTASGNAEPAAQVAASPGACNAGFNTAQTTPCRLVSLISGRDVVAHQAFFAAVAHALHFLQFRAVTERRRVGVYEEKEEVVRPEPAAERGTS